MSVRFLCVAEAELAEAVDYCNRQRAGLGSELAAEVRRALRRIVTHPEAWTLLSDSTRCCRTRRFPYAVVYQHSADELLVVAVMHLRRNPAGWRHRLDG